MLTTITLLLLCNISGLAFGINKSADTPIMSLSMQNNIVWVDDDYNESTPGWNNYSFNTIQAGVNAVDSSETIGIVHVYNGTYPETVIEDFE